MPDLPDNEEREKRRGVTHEARLRIALLSLFAVVGPAAAQDAWPSRQIRMVVPLPAGAAVDVIGRLVAAKLGERLGQTVVIENRAGASGAIGADAVAKAAPDGYTLGMATTTTHVTNAIVNSKLAYDPVKDFTPIALIGVVPYALSVSPKLPVKDVRELIALAKSKPGIAELFLGRSRQRRASRDRTAFQHDRHQAQSHTLSCRRRRRSSISPRAASTSPSARSGRACR